MKPVLLYMKLYVHVVLSHLIPLSGPLYIPSLSPPPSICGASPLLGRLLMKRVNPVALLVGASTAVILVTKLLVEYE